MKAFRPTCHTQHTDITRCTSRLTAPEPPPNAIKPLLRTPKTLSMHFTAFCPDSGELSGRSGQEWSSAGHFIISMATGGHCNVYFSFYIVCPRIPPMMCTTSIVIIKAGIHLPLWATKMKWELLWLLFYGTTYLVMPTNWLPLQHINQLDFHHPYLIY